MLIVLENLYNIDLRNKFMSRYLTSILFLLASLIAISANAESQIKSVSLTKLDGSMAEFQVGVCPEDAPVEARVKFTPANDEADFAEIQFFDLRDKSSFKCYANTQKTIVLDLKSLISAEMKKQNSTKLGAYLKALPVNIAVINAK